MRRLSGARTAAVTLAAIAGLLPITGTGGVSAAADTVVLPVRIALDGVSPSALTPGTTLVITGSVTNTGTRTLDAVRLRLRTATGALETRAQLSRWAQATPADDAGTRVDAATGLIGTKAPSQQSASVPAGQTRTFRLSVAAADLGLETSGLSPVGLAVEAVARRNGLLDRVGLVRTFTVWSPAVDYRPTAVSVLVPVTSSVARLDAGAPDAALADEMVSGGRLDAVLQATADTRVAWALDPAVESAAHTAVSGTEPAGVADAATAWLGRLAVGRAGRDVASLPWGDPDVAALARGHAVRLLAEADQRSAALSRSSASMAQVHLAWPAGGQADSTTLQLLTGPVRRFVVLNSLAMPATVGYTPTGLTVVPGTGGRLRGLLYDQAASDTLTCAGGANPVLCRQRLLADTAAITAERPSDARHVLLVTPRAWSPSPEDVRTTLTALSGVPWVQLRPLSTLVSAEPPAVRRTVAAYPRTAVAAELNLSHVVQVAADELSLSRLTRILDDPGPVVDPARTRALSIVGVTWRGHTRAELASARQALDVAVEAVGSGVRVVPPPPILLLSTSGPLPITLANALPYPVHVKLRLVPRTGQLTVHTEVDVEVPALKTTTTKVPSRAVANGNVEVEAQLLTPQGVPVGDPVTFQVRVRRDWEFRGLSVLAAVLLVLLLVGLVRGARRRRTRVPPELVPDVDDLAIAEEQRPRQRRTAPAPMLSTVPPTASAWFGPDGFGAAWFGSSDADGGRRNTPARHVRGQTTTALLRPSPPDDAGLADGLTPGGQPLDGLSPDEIAPDELTLGRPDPRGPDPDRLPPDGEGTGSVMRSSAVMAAGTLVSRILGFVRAWMLGWAIGASTVSADAFSIANKVPNIVYMLLAGGVLNAVLVPQITRADRDRDRERGREYVDRLVTVSITMLAALTIVVTASAPLLVALYNSSSVSSEQIALATSFAFWCLPQVLFYGLYTIWGQVLNARGAFAAYTWSPVLNNIVAILGLVIFVKVAGASDKPADFWTPGLIALFAGSATLGVASQAFILIPVLRHVGFRWRPRWGWRGVGMRAASRVAGWTFAAVVVTQLGFVVTSKVVTLAGDLTRQQFGGEASGGSFIYDLAFLLFMLPHSLVTVSLVTALFTRMSASAARGDVDAVRADVSVGLRITGVATVLATSAMVSLGPFITAVLFHGYRSAAQRGITAAATAMMLGLVPFSAQYLFQRAFYAYEDARTPFLIQLPAVAVGVIGNVVVATMVSPQWMVVGVGLSMTLGSVVGASLSALVLRRRIGGLDGARVVGVHVRLVLAAASAGLAAWASARALSGMLGTGLGAGVVVLVGGGVVLVTGYALLLRALRVSELGDLLSPLRRRASTRV